MKILLAFSLLFAAAAAIGQDRPAIAGQPNTVYVGADGRFEASPDTAVLQFDISAQDDTSRAAYDHASKAAEQIRQILRSNGIEPKNAEIGFFSLQPVYDYKTPKRKLVGYRVNANVTLKLKDFTKIAPILQQLADADVSEDQNLSYTLENMDEAKAKAVEDAYRRARESAAALAKAAGRSGGELSYASVDTSENFPIIRPMARMAAMNAAAVPAPSAEFSPQNITVTAHVNALFMLK